MDLLSVAPCQALVTLLASSDKGNSRPPSPGRLVLCHTLAHGHIVPLAITGGVRLLANNRDLPEYWVFDGRLYWTMSSAFGQYWYICRTLARTRWRLFSILKACPGVTPPDSRTRSPAILLVLWSAPRSTFTSQFPGCFMIGGRARDCSWCVR